MLDKALASPPERGDDERGDAIICACAVALVSIAEDASLVVHALQDIANTLSTLCAIDPRYQAAVASLEAGTAGGAT